MKARKILYICSGVFNCVIGGVGFLFGLLFLILTKIIRKFFENSAETIEEFVTELAATNQDYEYLLSASKDEVLSFVMKIVAILSIVLIVLGLIWIAFGVLNCVLSKRHDLMLGRKLSHRILFVVASWLLLTFNIANITTTVAVFLKDKNSQNTQPLYTSENNN